MKKFKLNAFKFYLKIISELENFVKTNEEANKIEKLLHDYDSLSDLVDITIEIF